MDKFQRLLKLVVNFGDGGVESGCILYWLFKGQWEILSRASKDPFVMRILERSELLAIEESTEEVDTKQHYYDTKYFLMPKEVVRAVRVLTSEDGE